MMTQVALFELLYRPPAWAGRERSDELETAFGAKRNTV
jgi:hypothetical protein